MENITISDKVHTKKIKRLEKYSKILIVWSFGLVLITLFILSDKALAYRWVFMIPILLLSILMLALAWKFNFKNDKLEQYVANSFEMRIAILSICTAFAVIFLFLHFKILYNGNPCQNEFIDARIEWFVWLSFAIGFVGACWAVLAKIKADDAFFASTEAFNEARKTLLSFGGSFDFDDIMSEETERMLPYLIKKASSELIVLISTPLVGFFRKPEMGKKFINILNHKLEEIAEQQYKGFEKVILIYFNDNISESYLQAWKQKEIEKMNKLPDQEKRKGIETLDELEKQYKDKIGELRKTVDRILRDKAENRIPDTVKTIEIVNYNEDIFFRFVTSMDKNERGQIIRQQALVWVVSDFNLDEPTKITDFNSAGFSTKDEIIIRVLQSLADDYVKKLPLLRR